MRGHDVRMLIFRQKESCLALKMKMRPLLLQEAHLLQRYLRMQLSLRPLGSLCLVWLMNLLWFMWNCMSFCRHPFQISCKVVIGYYFTGNCFSTVDPVVQRHWSTFLMVFINLIVSWLSFCLFQLKGSTLRDGISLRTLMRKSAALSGPGLLVWLHL